MNDSNPTLLHAVLVEDEVQFTLVELSRACRVDSTQLVAFVEEGVLAPLAGVGALAVRRDDPQGWRFSGVALRRARAALRLARDLELNAPAVAVVLDLLDQIEALRARLPR